MVKSREEIIAELKLAENEEGREGLVADYLAKHPEEKKVEEKPIEEKKKKK